MKAVIGGTVLHHPVSRSYSTAFLYPHFISGRENNSPVLTHLTRNQSGSTDSFTGQQLPCAHCGLGVSRTHSAERTRVNVA